MLSVDKFLKSYFNNNIDEYYSDLLSKLKKTTISYIDIFLLTIIGKI